MIGGRWKTAAMMAAALLLPSVSQAQTQEPIDRSDPAVVTEDERQNEASQPAPPERPTIRAAADDRSALSAESIVVGVIRVEGATILPPASFAAAIEPYLGRSLSTADLRGLAGAIADAARGAGFGLATAWVPAQDAGNGVLRVRLDEGRIDGIEARGPATAVVERLLAPLANREPVRTAVLERRLLLARDVAGVTVGSATLVRDGDRNVLRVETTRQRVRGRVSLDNWGTSAIGPLRARFGVDALGLFALGDALTVGATITPLNPSEFQLVQASYSLPIGVNGASANVGGYLTRSDAGGAFQDRDLEGDGVEIRAGFAYPWIRSRRQNLWGELSFSLRDNGLDRDGIRFRDDRIVAATGALFGAGRLAGGTVRVRVSLVQGLDLFGATDPGDPLASRRDGSGTFTKLRFWTDYNKRLGSGFSALLAGEGQLASRPLLATEEIGLGGPAFLRGYDYREFSGDKGAAGAAELRFDLDDLPSPLSRVQFYVYADAGRVTNLRGGAGGGSLASAGGGVRIGIDRRIEGQIGLGVPLADGRDGTRPDPRISFTLSAAF
jgi:hemolysin activation/secretion protein